VLAEWIASPSKQLTFEFEASLKVPFADNSSIEQLRATLDTLAGGLDTGLAEVQPYLRAIVDDGFGFQPQAHLSAMSIALIERLMVATYEWAVRAREIADGWDNVESTPEKEAWAHDVYRSVLTNLEPDPATQPGN